MFGIVEAITPVIGWALGFWAAGFVQNVDHWIAFALLALVGGRMIWETMQSGSPGEGTQSGRRGLWQLIATAIGTSIDAAAVGVGLAFIGTSIWTIAAAIGFSTFVCATIGMVAGRMLGRRFGVVAEVLGGVVLIGIGLMILLEHLGVLLA